MAYSSWSVVFGEQPSAAKWNILGTNDSSFNDGTGIASLSLSTTALSNPYKFRARRVAAFSPTANVFTKIVFDTEDYDTNGNFATGTYTAPVSGFYQFNAQYSGSNTGECVIALYKNGAVYQRGIHTLGNGTYGSGYSDTVQATISDTFDMYIFSNSGGAQETTAGSQSYFSGFLASRA